MVEMLLSLVCSCGSLPAELPVPCPVNTVAVAGQNTPSSQPPAERNHRLRITAATEVFLDGTLCPYEDVPAGAAIIFAEVGPDRQTLLRVSFRSQK